MVIKERSQEKKISFWAKSRKKISFFWEEEEEKEGEVEKERRKRETCIQTELHTGR